MEDINCVLVGVRRQELRIFRPLGPENDDAEEFQEACG
jgi:hypothetical protein